MDIYRRFLFFLIVAFSSSLPALGADALPDRDLSGLFGCQRQVSFDVSDYRDDKGRQWIHLSGEFEGAYRAKMDDLVAVLWDFKDAPKTFPRIEAVRVRSDDGTTAVVEQRTGVHMLGLSYISNLVFRNVISRDGKTAVFSFESIEVDDTTLSSRGSWAIEDRSDASGCASYVRYTVDSFVSPRFPAQAAIMRRFGAADIGALLRHLGEAAAKRAAKN
jgi:hypothetical protein